MEIEEEEDQTKETQIVIETKDDSNIQIDIITNKEGVYHFSETNQSQRHIQPSKLPSKFNYQPNNSQSTLQIVNKIEGNQIKDEQKLCYRQVEYEYVSLYKNIFHGTSMHLFGDFIIHTDLNNLNDYIGINSHFNQIKKAQQITNNKSNKTLEIAFERTNNQFVEIDGLIKLLQNQPDKIFHELGENLHKYKKYSLFQQKMSKYCQKQEGFEEFTRIKAAKFERFKQASQPIIDSYENENICYLYYKRNYSTGGVEIQNIGVNENMISLLGSNVQDYEELVRRVGIFIFQNKFHYNYIFSKYIQEMEERIQGKFDNYFSSGGQQINGIKKICHISYSGTILTMDDFVVNSENVVEIFVDLSDEDNDITTDILKFRDTLSILHVKPSTSTYQNLQALRSKNIYSQKEHNQKESLYYELETSIFLEKYYSSNHQRQKDQARSSNQQNSMKMCKYKNIPTNTI